MIADHHGAFRSSSVSPVRFALRARRAIEREVRQDLVAPVVRRELDGTPIRFFGAPPRAVVLAWRIAADHAIGSAGSEP